jgi:hypothetical protein
MNTAPAHTTTPSRSRQLWSSVRDELRERRQARAAERTFVREIRAYSTPADVEDLLGAVRNQDGPDADRIRGILSRNLQHRQRTNAMAS